MMHSTGFAWQNPTRGYHGDAWLIIMALLLLTFGLVMMTSASIEIASRQYDDPFYHFKRQLVFLFIGMLAFENVAASEVIVTDQLGILAGTLLSAFAGSLVLYFVLPRSQGRNR